MKRRERKKKKAESRPRKDGKNNYKILLTCMHIVHVHVYICTCTVSAIQIFQFCGYMYTFIIVHAFNDNFNNEINDILFFISSLSLSLSLVRPLYP